MLNLKNKRGLYGYSIKESIECGIVLLGPEVGAIHKKNVTFNKSSHAYFVNNELFITNLAITTPINNPNRLKKLLINKKEAIKLNSKVKEKGFTLVPVRLYTKGHLIKLELALCKGLNSVGKKRELKEKDIKRDTDRQIKFRQY